MNEENELDELLKESNIKEELRLSFSRINGFLQNGCKALIERKQVSGEGIRMGGLIDTLLFEPDTFNDSYYINTNTPPNKGTAADKVIDFLFDNFSHEELLKVFDNKLGILKFCEKLVNDILDIKIFGRTKDPEKIFTKITDSQIWDTVKSIIKSKDKQLISPEEYNNALEVVDVLKTHKHTKDLFRDDDPHLYYQFKVEFEYKGFNFLSLLDIVEIDHDNKTIQLKDLKTGAKNQNEFLSSFLKYNYHFQAKLYQIAGNKIKELLQIEEYKLKPFQFIYISRYERLPVVFTVTDKWMEASQKGFVTPSGYEYKGLDEVIDLIEWHHQNNVFNMSKELYEANGNINLKDSFIKISE